MQSTGKALDKAALELKLLRAQVNPGCLSGLFLLCPFCVVLAVVPPQSTSVVKYGDSQLWLSVLGLKMSVCKEVWLVWGSAKGGGPVHEGVTRAAWHSTGALSVSRALLLFPERRADLSQLQACAGKQPPRFNF